MAALLAALDDLRIYWTCAIHRRVLIYCFKVVYSNLGHCVKARATVIARARVTHMLLESFCVSTKCNLVLEKPASFYRRQHVITR